MATTPAQTVSPLAMVTPEDEPYVQEIKASRKALQDALFNRQQLLDPTLLAMAQGFLAPTRSGGFGESLGNVAARVAPVQEQEQQRAVQMAQLRSELATQELGERQAARRQEALGKMYKKDEAGNLTMDLDAALRYAQLTGDPKIFAEVAAKQKEVGLQSARDQVFKPTAEGKYSFDPSGLGKVFALGGAKELAEIVKSVPELRRMGLLGEVGAEGTPFDAIATLAKDPLIRQQAIEAAGRYKKGLIDDKQAENLSKDMMQMHLAQFNAEQARAQTAALHAITTAIQRDRADEAARLAREKFEEKKASEAEPKVKAAKDVESLLDDMAASYNSLKELGSITDTSGGALANALASVKISGVGQFIGGRIGTKTQEQVNNISTARPLLLQAIKNATGMTASQMNSNRELQFFLDAATDPKLGYQANMKAIERLKSLYGLGAISARTAERAGAPAAPAAPGATPSAAPARPAGAVPRWNPATGKWE